MSRHAPNHPLEVALATPNWPSVRWMVDERRARASPPLPSESAGQRSRKSTKIAQAISVVLNKSYGAVFFAGTLRRGKVFAGRVAAIVGPNPAGVHNCYHSPPCVRSHGFL